MVVKRSDGLSSPLFTFIHMPHLVRFTSRLLILYFFDLRKIAAAVTDAKRLTYSCGLGSWDGVIS